MFREGTAGRAHPAGARSVVESEECSAGGHVRAGREGTGARRILIPWHVEERFRIERAVGL
jgi:hypothetical protein